MSKPPKRPDLPDGLLWRGEVIHIVIRPRLLPKNLDQDGRYDLKAFPVPSFAVSPALQERAIHIYDLITKTLIGLGHEVTIEEPRDSRPYSDRLENRHTAYVVVHGLRISIRIQEDLKRELVPADQRKDFFSNRIRMAPSGVLSLHLDYVNYGPKHRFSDRKRVSLEERLPEVLETLLRLGDDHVRGQWIQRLRTRRQHRAARVAETAAKRKERRMQYERRMEARQEARERDVFHRCRIWEESQRLGAFYERVKAFYGLDEASVDAADSRSSRWCSRFRDRIRNLERQALERIWVPDPDAPPPSVQSSAKTDPSTRTPPPAQDISALGGEPSQGLFAGKNFWQRKFLTERMHGRR